MDEIKIGSVSAFARRTTKVIRGFAAWVPGRTEVLVYGDGVDDLRAAFHFSEVIGEPLMYRSREAPAPFPFEIPGADRVEYQHGVWHLKRGARVARATWFGGYSQGAPWYFSSDLGAGSSVEWDRVGHWSKLHPLYAEESRHVGIIAAYVTLLEHLEVPMSDADLGFELPYGGRAMRLDNDGSVLVFHPKRAAAWRILGGETFFAGSDGAPWTKCPPLTADVVVRAWGDTGARPAPPAAPPQRAWEVADAKNPDAPIKLPATSAKDLVVVVRLDGEDVVVSEDGDVDYEMFADVEDWTIYTAA